MFENESDFKRELIQGEVDKLNEDYPLEDNKFDFRINFIVENKDDFEVEFYFRNNTAQSLIFGKLPLHFVYNGGVIAIKNVDFRKEFGEIPAKSVKACSFKIEKENVYYPHLMDESMLVLGVNLKFKVTEIVEDNIVNMPENLSYDQELYFNEKIKELPSLAKNSFNINTLTLAADIDKNVDIVLIVRNGYENDIKVEKLPIQILNEIDIPIYIGMFNPEDMIVEGNSSKLYLIKVKKGDLLKEYDDYSNFTVKIG